MLYWRFAVQYQYPQTSIFRRKNKTYFTLNLVQNWTSLLTASKNNWKWLKNCYDSSALKKRTTCLVQGLRVDKEIITKFWKVAKIVNVMFLRNFKKSISRSQIKVFFIVFFSVFNRCSLFFIRTFDYHQNNKVAEDTYQ